MTRPTDSEPFRYDGYTIDVERGALSCRYHLGKHHFSEQITFGPEGDWSAPAVDAAARLVFLLAGVSYYKTAAPALIDLGSTATTPAERAFLRQVYVEGLGVRPGQRTRPG